MLVVDKKVGVFLLNPLLDPLTLIPSVRAVESSNDDDAPNRLSGFDVSSYNII